MGMFSRKVVKQTCRSRLWAQCVETKQKQCKK